MNDDDQLKRYEHMFAEGRYFDLCYAYCTRGLNQERGFVYRISTCSEGAGSEKELAEKLLAAARRGILRC